MADDGEPAAPIIQGAPLTRAGSRRRYGHDARTNAGPGPVQLCSLYGRRCIGRERGTRTAEPWPMGDGPGPAIFGNCRSLGHDGKKEPDRDMLPAGGLL